MRTVLSRPDFRLLFGGLLASMTAESILLLALAIWVKDLTGSDSLAGATIFVILAPRTLAPLVGWFVDRYPRQPFFVATNLAMALLLTPLFAVRDAGDLWIIYAVAALYGLSNLTVGAVLSRLIQEMVPSDLLGEANGALQTVRQGLRLVGPLAGAGLYAVLGGWILAAVGMAGFLVAAAVVGALRVAESSTPPTDRPAERPADGVTRVWRLSSELVAGVRHLAGEPALRRALLGYGLASLVMGFTESLIFAYVDRGLERDATFVGVLVTVQGIGGLVGGLCSAAVLRRLGELGTLAAGVAFFGPAALALAYPNLWLGFTAVLLAGLSLPLTLVGLHTLIQRRTPPELTGRVAAASEAVIRCPQALSVGVGALVVGVLDYRAVFVSIGLATLLAGGYLWAGRRLSPPAAPAARTRVPAPRPAAEDQDPAPVGTLSGRGGR
ncbi:MFS transporter [Micromonospora craniellae]|uniref:MFS transporter n=1 Tax=Micromonospora craniellae TaxID=2294034 RepID=A0A372G585_9ACTN|nr:MFS transporter [Micromonospora craniellae]QOC90464.1 MFS transporter [Micromonospora craniellae]RFS48148.1 MFS transporter [Micromonospora craniellae]